MINSKDMFDFFQPVEKKKKRQGGDTGGVLRNRAKSGRATVAGRPTVGGTPVEGQKRRGPMPQNTGRYIKGGLAGGAKSAAKKYIRTGDAGEAGKEFAISTGQRLATPLAANYAGQKVMEATGGNKDLADLAAGTAAAGVKGVGTYLRTGDAETALRSAGNSAIGTGIRKGSEIIGNMTTDATGNEWAGMGASNVTGGVLRGAQTLLQGGDLKDAGKTAAMSIGTSTVKDSINKLVSDQATKGLSGAAASKAGAQAVASAAPLVGGLLSAGTAIAQGQGAKSIRSGLEGAAWGVNPVLGAVFTAIGMGADAIRSGEKSDSATITFQMGDDGRMNIGGSGMNKGLNKMWKTMGRRNRSQLFGVIDKHIKTMRGAGLPPAFQVANLDAEAISYYSNPDWDGKTLYISEANKDFKMEDVAKYVSQNWSPGATAEEIGSTSSSPNYADLSWAKPSPKPSEVVDKGSTSAPLVGGIGGFAPKNMNLNFGGFSL